METRRFLPGLSIMLMVLMSFFFNVAYGKADKPDEYPDIFAYEDTYIDVSYTVGRLMVAGGNATVGGKVTEGIVLVDGSLTLEPTARVSGKIIILGGSVTLQQGAEIRQTPWIIAPQGHLLVPVLVGFLSFLAAVSLILIPVLVWLIGHFLKKAPWYTPVKKIWLEIERRWPALYIASSLLVSALLLTAFIEIAWETIFRKTMMVYDTTFIWFIRYFHSPLIDQAMIGISDAGFGVSYIIIVTSTLLLLIYKERWQEIVALAICLAGGAALNLLLKYLFKRARPELFAVVQETGFSFPSGHAMASMCFYGMTAFLLMRSLSSWRGRLLVMTGAAIVVVAIGISRIYLGVHYPSDVVAGYAAGSMWLFFCISFLMLWEQEKEKAAVEEK